jgi:endonuclease/exonuclease/phosphatase family metal-dependent hydrolase
MIKIMSFNIRTASANDGKNGWQNRKLLVLERIRAFSPDLLGVQECRNDDQAEFMKNSLADYDFIGFERGGKDDTGIEMAPVLIKESSFEVLDAGCFWLSETPDIPGSTSWGGYFPRTVTWTKLKSKQNGGRIVYFFNTHFDYANLQVQIESAKLLKKHIASLENNPPVILCGDFNIEKESAPYRILLEGAADSSDRLQDCYRQGHSAPWNGEGTFHDFGALDLPSALDGILVSAHFCTVKASIDRFRQENVYPSDHYPLIASANWMNSV